MIDPRIDETIEPRRCVGVTKAGERCKQTLAILPSGFCGEHDPEKIAEREARKNGSEPPGPPRTLDDCAKWLAYLTTAVQQEKMSASNARVIVQGVKELRQVLLGRDLLDQVRRLEAKIARMEDKGKR